MRECWSGVSDLLRTTTSLLTITCNTPLISPWSSVYVTQTSLSWQKNSLLSALIDCVGFGCWWLTVVDMLIAYLVNANILLPIVVDNWMLLICWLPICLKQIYWCLIYCSSFLLNICCCWHADCLFADCKSSVANLLLLICWLISVI